MALKELEAEARTMPARHREEDQRTVEQDLRDRKMQRIHRLQANADQKHQWLTNNSEDNKGSTSKPRKNKRTDNRMRSRDVRFAEQNKHKALSDPLHSKDDKPKFEGLAFSGFARNT